MQSNRSGRHELLRQALSAVREETLRRLDAAGLPSSVLMSEQFVIEQVGGWRSESREVQRSPLLLDTTLILLRDESVPFAAMGFRSELQKLADYLAETTDLASRPSYFFPDLVGADAVLTRYLSQLALFYISALHDVAEDNPELIGRLLEELDELCDSAETIQTAQLAITGPRLDQALLHEGVRIRPLTSAERGLLLEGSDLLGRRTRFPETGFVRPQFFENFMPNLLLEVDVARAHGQQPQQTTMPAQIALSFFLHGFDLSANGTLVLFDRPQWATIGFHYPPFPVANKRAVSEERVLTEQDFAAIVDLALQMPEFLNDRQTPHEVALDRLLRACGAHWQAQPFLDYAICLEAALLGGVKDELAYRFALYGALFLQDTRNATETFAKLRNIYRHRSELVHGGRVRADRAAAQNDAADLAKAVVLQALTSDWPHPELLDELALKEPRSPAK